MKHENYSLLTFRQWEALWLLTLGQVEFNTFRSRGKMHLVARAAGVEITSRFEALEKKDYVTIHKPGWLNGEACGWRIEITNAGWKAMDQRPVRASARHGVHDGDTSGD